jgi:hypothetical protein
MIGAAASSPRGVLRYRILLVAPGRNSIASSGPAQIDHVVFEWRTQNGGEGEIRTPVTRKGKPAFEAGAIDHSATSPRRWRFHYIKYNPGSWANRPARPAHQYIPRFFKVSA